jgi:hypothetical protein
VTATSSSDRVVGTSRLKLFSSAVAIDRVTVSTRRIETEPKSAST